MDMEVEEGTWRKIVPFSWNIATPPKNEISNLKIYNYME